MNKKIKTDEEEIIEPRAQADAVQLDEVNVRISNHPYKIIDNYRDGFDREKFAERYSDVLKKYDYIVGDWGYDQLRLKGFFNKNYSQAKMDQRIENVEDYLLEYCNFGCAYFVLENLKKMPKSKLKKTTPNRSNNNQKNRPKKTNNNNSQKNKTNNSGPKKNNNSNNRTKKSSNNTTQKNSPKKNSSTVIKKNNNSEVQKNKQVRSNKPQPNKKGPTTNKAAEPKKRNFNIRKINEEK